MRIQKSIKKTIDELQNKDLESAIMHICNAIDGTAQKKNGTESSRKIFTDFIRSYYDLISAMAGFSSLDLKNTIWPFETKRCKKPDFAEMIYGIHRCLNNHGVDIPDGFEFIPDVADSTGTRSINIKKGAIGLSDRFIWALIVIVVLDPINKGIADPVLDGYFFKTRKKDYIINEWWGRLDEFPKLPPKTSNVILDFSELQ